jgi:putative ABC transport system permease protein
VAQSRADIGIRMAIGARGQDVVRQFVGEGLALTSLGIGVGAVGAYAVTRLMTAVLFGVTPTDLPTFAGIALLMILVGVLAVYIPARRAASVDPLIALRHD